MKGAVTLRGSTTKRPDPNEAPMTTVDWASALKGNKAPKAMVTATETVFRLGKQRLI
jgi:hypothetical protein